MDQVIPSDSKLRPSDTDPGVDRADAEKTNGGTLGDATATLEETKVIYHIDEEETPYKVTVSPTRIKIKIMPKLSKQIFFFLFLCCPIKYNFNFDFRFTSHLTRSRLQTSNLFFPPFTKGSSSFSSPMMMISGWSRKRLWKRVQSCHCTMVVLFRGSLRLRGL